MAGSGQGNWWPPIHDDVWESIFLCPTLIFIWHIRICPWRKAYNLNIPTEPWRAFGQPNIYIKIWFWLWIIFRFCIHSIQRFPLTFWTIFFLKTKNWLQLIGKHRIKYTSGYRTFIVISYWFSSKSLNSDTIWSLHPC